jgi:iron complex transport system substrate-binding protein
MRKLTATAMLLLAAAACSSPRTAVRDDRLVVFGPSLVELMFAGGLGERIVGVDRYSTWPPAAAEIAVLGGFLDPSLEVVASLAPTSVHSAGANPEMVRLCASLDIPIHVYRFDRLADVWTAMDSLEARYGAGFAGLRSDLRRTLDSLRAGIGERGGSIALVIWHDPGSGSLTLAGRGTFLADIVDEIGLTLAAPGTGTYPTVSVEGLLSLTPDRILMLLPDQAGDSAAVTERERDFWAGFGYPPDSVDCAFGGYLLVPGSRIGLTARRIAACSRSR